MRKLTTPEAFLELSQGKSIGCSAWRSTNETVTLKKDEDGQYRLFSEENEEIDFNELNLVGDSYFYIWED